MGFIKKIGKGIKSAFKKIGKGIKSAFKSVGKFMDKIGILGQIGLSLLLPGIGSMLSGAWGSLVGGLQAYGGVGSSIVNGAGNFLNAATKVASNITKPFTTITEGVKNVVGETLKAGANALGFDKAAISLGKKFGSQYLQDLGANISNANLTSIGDAFDEGVEGFLGSFSGGGVDPTGAYEKARLEATTASPAEIASITPPTPQFADPDIVTPDMPATVVKTDSLLSPAVDVTPPVVGDPSAVVNRQLMTDAEFLDIAQPDFTDTTKRGFIEKTYDRAVTAATKMIQEAPEKAMDKLGSTITDMPSQFARRAVGLDPDPVFNQVSYATVVPTIQEAPMVGSQPMMDPVQYVANNQESMALQPFGLNANMYNAATYMNTMRKYGFA
jgi:hypothetical protein